MEEGMTQTLEQWWQGMSTPFAKLIVLETIEGVARGCAAVSGYPLPATDWERWKTEHLCAVWPE